MKIRELSIQTIPKHKNQKAFNSGCWCIKEMYWYQLRKLSTKDIAKLVVILGEDKPTKRFKNILSIYREFDFDNYFKKKEYEKKKIVLQILHSELSAIADEQGIDRKILNHAFQYCVDHNFENKWLFKNKCFKSPNNKYYGAVECDWKIDKFTATGIILDKKKNELWRERLIETEPYFGDFIYYCKCGWDDNVFFLQSKEKDRWQIFLK